MPNDGGFAAITHSNRKVGCHKNLSLEEPDRFSEGSSPSMRTDGSRTHCCSRNAPLIPAPIWRLGSGSPREHTFTDQAPEHVRPTTRNAHNLWNSYRLKIGYSLSTMTDDERMQRESSL